MASSRPRARPPEAPAAGHRSGAVARMLRMPVATLRVWERRYALTRPALSPTGQRLYSDDDVRRLALIRQLTDLGHAIGRLAPLDMTALLHIAATHAQTLAAAQPARPAGATSDATPWRVAVIGTALGRRVRRLDLGPAIEWLGPFETAADAAAVVADAWLLHCPELHAGTWSPLQAALPAVARGPAAVLYGFAPGAVCEDLAAQGVALLREPQPDVALAQWLRHWTAASASRSAARGIAAPVLAAVAPRRWDDAALADFAALSTTVACECPRHVAELLVQLSRFESYSAQCRQRSAADAALHAYLGQVAAQARAAFEAALEQVARHEGLLLPPAR